jgi:hypothetical protein
MPIEAKDATKRASKDIKALKGSKEGMALASKDIGSSSGSKVQEGVEVVETRGKRVVQRPQRYQD